MKNALTTLAALILMAGFATQAIAGDYTDNGDGTITDNDTGLVWQKVANSYANYWLNALMYCEDLVLAGHSDWRLPNVKELQSLVDDSRINPAWDTNHFAGPMDHYYYWSSTTFSSVSTHAWVTEFSTGVVWLYGKNQQNFHVRCVRGGL